MAKKAKTPEELQAEAVKKAEKKVEKDKEARLEKEAKITIGQKVLINKINPKRKAAENIPYPARASVISISHGTGRDTIFNVQVEVSGHKHGLASNEFDLINL